MRMSHISRIRIDNLLAIEQSQQALATPQLRVKLFSKNLTSSNRSKIQSHLHPYNQFNEILDGIDLENKMQSRLFTTRQIDQEDESLIENNYVGLLGLNFPALFSSPSPEISNLAALQSKEEYRNTVRDQLLRKREGKLPNPLLKKEDFDKIGYRDEFGYIVRYEDGEPNSPGEATYDIAIAVVAIATGNYKQDAWDSQNANARLEELLDVLLEKSWGNRDGFGREHPIRHPNLFDYDRAGKNFRASPLSKDSFGQIIAAGYYAYQCPNSSSKVREKARTLIQKWTDYLVLNQWRLHSNYIPGEFEQDGDKFKNIFDKKGDPSGYTGLETFLLFPHEIYALQNVALSLGIPTAGWNIWLNVSVELRRFKTEVQHLEVFA